MIEVEEIFDKLDWNDRLRCLNFCEIEFGIGGAYGWNNQEEIKEILLEDFECSAEEILDMFYKNQYFNDEEKFFYTTGRGIETISENIIKDEFTFVTDNLCNGELKEMIEYMIDDDINY